jgi:hypothetical protein
METSTQVLIGMAIAMVTALGGFAVYKWRMRQRAGQVKKWLEHYLIVRYGALPNQLSMNCSDDPLWPVLVAFNNPRTGIRHKLQFACQDPHRACSLLSEMEEKR